MINVFILIVIGSGLLITSLRLEAQTTGKCSREYVKLKRVGGTGAVLSWIGIVILSILYAF